MKTVNLRVPEEVWRLSRVEAARDNTSLSGLVREYLIAMTEGKISMVLPENNQTQDLKEREELVALLASADLWQ